MLHVSESERQHVTVLRQKAADVLASSESCNVVRSLLTTFPELKLYLAGGVLRDLALDNGRLVHDFDFFFTGAESQQVIEFLGKRGIVEHGPFGSPRWFPSRDKSRYADIVPIPGFYNGLWRCEDIVDVLNQFDFTANALAIDVRTLELYSPQNALRDQRARIMRAVRFDYPDEPISSHCTLTRHCVLWFRLLHYAAVLGLSVEPVTRGWLRDHTDYLRLFEEFSRYFFQPNLSALQAIR